MSQGPSNEKMVVEVYIKDIAKDVTKVCFTKEEVTVKFQTK